MNEDVDYERLIALSYDEIDKLTAKLEKAQGQIERLNEALEEKGLSEVWSDGYRACLAVADSYRIHVTWGPEATPDDGLKHGIDGLRDVLHRAVPLPISPLRDLERGQIVYETLEGDDPLWSELTDEEKANMASLEIAILQRFSGYLKGPDHD